MPKNSKFGPLIGLLVIRNENDILAQTLEKQSQYCDHIYVLDGTDEGPEISKKICLSLPNVSHFTEDALPADYPRPIKDGCRQFLIEKAREKFGYNGWFVLLHGDELFVDSPVDIISKHHRFFDCLTVDVPLFFIHKEQEPFKFDPSRPVEEQIFWHAGPGWPETRMFRNTERINYDPQKHGVIPQGVRFNYKTTFKVKHFAFRDPALQAKRAHDRTEVTKWQTGGYSHVKEGKYYLDESFFGKKFLYWISKQPLKPRINDPFIKRLFEDIVENWSRQRIRR